MTASKPRLTVSVAGLQFEPQFAALLVLLLAFITLAPVLQKGAEGTVALNVLFGISMLAAMDAAGVDRRYLLVVLAASGVAVLADAAGEIADAGGWDSITAIINPALLVITLTAVLVRVVQSKRVTFDTVLGALCAYVLLGLFWTFIFAGVDKIDDTAFNFPDVAEERLADYLYFSFIAMTTVGFGDITPASTGARSLVVLEAIIGQVYLVVLVARLVALQIAHGDDDAAG